MSPNSAYIYSILSEAIAAKNSAAFVVSGGSSPIKIFQELSNSDLDWSKVTITLVDDRAVDKNHNDSNEKRDKEGRTRNIAGAINLAFYQPENCYLRRTDTKEELPFENCTGFWFDNGVNHEALNSSDENRFHFIMHGGFNKEREELMKRSLVKQFGKDVLKEINE